MKEIFRKFDINTKIYKERAVLADISHAKDELITPEEMELNAGAIRMHGRLPVCIRNISLSSGETMRWILMT